MGSGERDGDGGARKPPAEGAEAAAASVRTEEVPLEVSRRGRIVVRSSSHPPGETPPYSDPPDGAGSHAPGGQPDASTPPQGRSKRDTPAERPRGRRAARENSSAPDAAITPSRPPGELGRGTTVLWAIIVALSAALAYALMR